jgi:NhaP-type Na+/H+ or K+/H+ antiporter
VPFDVIVWYLLIGVLLVSVGAAGPFLKKAWLSTSTLYLGVGLLMGPMVLGLLDLNLLEDARFIEHLTEIAVVV